MQTTLKSPINLLVNPPEPPNSNYARSMYVWFAHWDPLATNTTQQNLINFCGTYGIDTLFLDMYPYLGAANWTQARVDRMKQTISAAHASGIKVYALAGNTDWPTNQQWVMRNILKPIVHFNNLAVAGNPVISAAFDGIMLDVEYWTVPGYNSAVELPGLCDLMKAMRANSGLPVGCFAAQFLSGNPNVSYNGKNQSDGYHLIDNSDVLVVACFSNSGATQSIFFQPWYNYASAVSRNIPMYCGSDTTDLGDSTTYFAMSKNQMEGQHAIVSGNFQVDPSANAVFAGQSINEYYFYNLME